MSTAAMSTNPIMVFLSICVLFLFYTIIKAAKLVIFCNISEADYQKNITFASLSV